MFHSSFSCPTIHFLTHSPVSCPINLHPILDHVPLFFLLSHYSPSCASILPPAALFFFLSQYSIPPVPLFFLMSHYSFSCPSILPPVPVFLLLSHHSSFYPGILPPVPSFFLLSHSSSCPIILPYVSVFFPPVPFLLTFHYSFPALFFFIILYYSKSFPVPLFLFLSYYSAFKISSFVLLACPIYQ